MKTSRIRDSLLFVVVAVLFFFGFSGVVCQADDGVYKITDFGAKGDGKTINTKAIQSAIDACNKAGGGRVLVPSGKFMTGMIIMKDNVELHLSHGAILQGGLAKENYPLMAKPEFRSWIFDNYRWYSLIYAEKAKHIAITGSGTLQGPGTKFKPFDYRGKVPMRPRIILFISCKDIRVKDIHFRDSVFWIQHYINCENIIIRGIDVYSWNHNEHGNNDGMNIDCCRQVNISDCIIYSEDDSIVFKTTGPAACRNIAVSNCVLKSRSNGIKFGTESHDVFENISISNCTIWGTRGAGIGFYMNDGGMIRRVTISNVTVENCRVPIFISAQDRGRKYREDMEKPGIGIIRDVTISNFNARGSNDVAPIELRGAGSNYPLENITLSNIRVSIEGGPIAVDYGGRKKASLLYGGNIKGLRISNMQLVTDKPDERPPVVLGGIDGLVLDDIDAPESSTKLPMIQFGQVKDVIVRGCQPVGDTFITIAGGGVKNVMIVGNNFTNVMNPVKMGTGIAKDEVEVFSNKKPGGKSSK